METTNNPRRTYRVRTTDWHVQVVHPVHGGYDRGRPIDGQHIEWSRAVPDGHPDRPAALAAAAGIARLLNEHLPLEHSPADSPVGVA